MMIRMHAAGALALLGFIDLLAVLRLGSSRALHEGSRPAFCL